jgi:hypothetical protein
MGFVKLIVSLAHVTDEAIDDTYRRWLKADAVMGNAEALDKLNAYHESLRDKP